MAERVQRRRETTRDEDVAVETATTRKAVDYNAILDEIDTVLDADAQEYVRSFVQKGGQ